MPLSTTVDVATKTALKLCSLRLGISMSDILRMSLLEYLEKQPTRSSDTLTLF